MSKKLLISILLIGGLISLLIGISPVFDKEKTPDDTKIIFGGITGTFVFWGISGYFIWDNRQKQKSEKEKISYLRKIFVELVEIADGKITILEFVSHVSRQGRRQISGDEARVFLEQMAKEFDAGYEFTDYGNTVYIFGAGENQPVQKPNLKVEKSIEKVEKILVPTPTSVEKTRSNLIPLDSYLLQKLEENLAQQNWQKADEITSQLILKASGQTISLNPDDISNLPVGHLQKIDELWQINSDSRFGFLAQLEVFKDCFPNQGKIILDSEKWRKYGSALGWYVNAKWPNHHHDLNFSLDAPKGHLPFLPIWQGTWWGGFIDGQGERFYFFLKRIEQSKLCTYVRFDNIGDINELYNTEELLHNL
ncbi:GUN4 domain-containing protein [Synechocystis sp. CACIAM 05]|uniref:GUN4 domain-containing protein n=1 Tax=Synechocystis sp. CACIAM 05 TaxID=1933929 RepID=UPI00138E58A0|nr:GUN4 domain-containing protein [Synechocystis sp. CACIAM 05]QHV01106.1 hypothetical protein BWK47_13825 [Synechocystis sp. CACIAM 05]